MEKNLREKHDELLMKYEEIKKQHQDVVKKLSSLNKDPNGRNIGKDLLGLEPGKIYLIITDGRRIVGKLIFESKSFVCYSKREGIPYYANKSNIKLIKELSTTEQKSYLSSNFGKILEEEESEAID
jgi:hypothetical protein